MKTILLIATLVLGLNLAVFAGTESGHSHAKSEPAADTHTTPHAMHTAPNPDQVLPEHGAWVPDAALIAGMLRIDTAVQVLEHSLTESKGKALTLEQTGEIKAAIVYIFEQCKLEPEADAVLHGLLARLITANQKLAANPRNPVPVTEMRAVIVDYQRLFKDPMLEDASSEPAG